MPNLNIRATSCRFIFFALSSLLLVACDNSDSGSTSFVQKAAQYLEQKQMREAVIELKHALKTNPKNGEARYMLGNIYIDLGDSAAAEKELRRAEEAGWSKEQTTIGLSRVLVNTNDLKKMVTNTNIDEKYSKTSKANLHGLHAIAFLGLGQTSDARESLNRGRTLDPTALYILKANVILQLSDDSDTPPAKAIEQALSAHPDNSSLLLLSARISSKNDDLSATKEALHKVLDNDPLKLVTVYGRKARLELSSLALQEDDLAQAQILLEPVFKQNANDVKAGYLAGMLAFDQGNLELAEERLLRVLKVAPNYSQAQLMYGTVSYAKEDYTKAIYYLEKYNSAVTGNIQARKLLGRSYIMLGQHSEAQRVLKPALGVAGDDPELLTLIGLSELESGNSDSAIAGLEKAAKAAPESKVIHEALIKAYITEGDSESAIQALNKDLKDGETETDSVTLILLAYIRTGEFEKATKMVTELLAKNPDDPALLTQTGNVYAASGKFNEAAEFLEKALKIEPGYLAAAMTLANLEEVVGRPEEAAIIYQQLVDGDEKSILPLLGLARTSGKQGKPSEQLTWLEKAQAREPKNTLPLLLLADYYLKNKQTLKAKQYAQEGLKIAPNDPRLLTTLSKALINEKKYNAALSPLNTLVDKDPESIQGNVLLAEAKLKLGLVADAKKHLKIVLDKKPKQVLALSLMVSASFKSAEYNQALKYAIQIQKAAPEQALGYELAGDASLSETNFARAKVEYQKAWQLQPSAAIAVKLAQVAKLSGKPQDADKYLLLWLKQQPNDAYALRLLANAYYSMDRKQDAITQYDKVLTIQPENYVALNNLATIHSELGNPEAIIIAEKAYKLSPKSAGILDTYGWLLVQQGQLNKGKSLLKQASDILPDSAEIKYHYAMSLHKTGKKGAATDLLRELIQSDAKFDGRAEAERLLQTH